MRIKNAAWLLPLLAAFFFSLAGCSTPPTGEPAVSVSPSHHYTPSSHRIIGYILDIDEARGFAIVDLTVDPLTNDLHAGTVLRVRSRDLHPTARLSATRYLRGHTLGAKIVTGLPAVGEEVTLSPP